MNLACLKVNKKVMLSVQKNIYIYIYEIIVHKRAGCLKKSWFMR